MIKIIKSGKKEFHTTCPCCGCEFTYEIEDLHETDYVNCPECNADVPHLSRDLLEMIYKDSDTIKPPTPFIAPQIKATDNNPCANCNYIKKIVADHLYVGDVPCTWCEYNPFKVTCTNVYTATNTNTNVTIDPGKTEGGGITFNNDRNK